MVGKLLNTQSVSRARRLAPVVVLLADLGLGSAAWLTDTRARDTYLVLLLWPTLTAAVLMPRRFVMAQVAVVAAITVAAPSALGMGAMVRMLALTVSVAAAAYLVTEMRGRLHHTREQLAAQLDESRRVSASDPLTGLANRRGLEERLPGMWNAATRRKEALSVLLLHLDQLEAIDVQHGHVAADEALTELGGFVRSLVRTEDIVARLGGRELVVVTSDASTAGPADIGERLRRAVEDASLGHPITVTVGAVRYSPTDLDDPLPTFAGLLEDAGEALDAARRAGTNRVVGLSSPPFLIPPPRSAAS